MNASDTTATRAVVAALWPRTSAGRFAWTTMEWSTFIETCARIPIDSEQANAALRNLKATSEKYPSVAGLLKALQAAGPAHVHRGCSPRPDEPGDTTSPEYTLACWRNQLGLDPQTGRGETVEAYYRDGFARSVRLRGYVSEKVINAAHAHLIELASFSPEEADQWCFDTNERAERYARCISADDQPSAKQEWWATIVNNSQGRVDAAHFEKQWVKEHNAKPKRLRSDRRPVLKQLKALSAQEPA